MSANRILILGIGNYLMGDEGIGVHLARSLENVQLPEGIDVLDGGTGGFHLLEYFLNYPIVILVDATLDGRPAGTIRLLKPRFAADFPQAMSTHDIGMKDLICSLQLLDKIPRVYLFAVSIETIQQQGIELTSALTDVLPILQQQVLALTETIEVEMVL